MSEKNKEKQKSKLINTFLLQLKSVMSQPLLIFFIFIFPSIFITIISVFVAEYDMFIASFGIPIILLTLLIFINVYNVFKKSTLNKNLGLLGYGEFIFVFSLYLLIFLLVLIAAFIELTFFIVFETLKFSEGFFQSVWWFYNPETSQTNLDIVWSNVNYMPIIFYFVVTITLSFLFISIFRNKINSQKTFSIFMFVYLLLFLFLGSSVTLLFNEYDYANESISIHSVMTGEEDTAVPLDRWQTYFSFVFPQKFLNEHFFSVLRVGAEPLYDVDSSELVGHQAYLPADANFFKYNKDLPYWNLTLYLPLAYCGLFGLVSWRM